MPWWAKALREVDRSQPQAITPPPANAGYYSFPDPGLFIGGVPEQRRQHLIESWLRVMDTWLSSGNFRRGMKNQRWRDLLHLDFTEPVSTESGSTRTSQRRAQAIQLLLPRGTTFRSQAGLPYEWRGQKFPAGTPLPNNVIREIVYHLYQLNFQHEILALDALAHDNGSQPLTDFESLQRETAICRLFPDNTFGYPTFIPPNTGLAADNIRERLPFYMNFGRIMDSWKGIKPDAFRYAHRRQEDSITNAMATELEAAVTKYYCQQYYNYFQRAPQIPYRLFEPSQASQDQ